jgi:hypothetical protein
MHTLTRLLLQIQVFLSGTQLAFKYVKECPCLWETTYIYSIYLFIYYNLNWLK